MCLSKLKELQKVNFTECKLYLNNLNFKLLKVRIVEREGRKHRVKFQKLRIKQFECYLEREMEMFISSLVNLD